PDGLVPPQSAAWRFTPIPTEVPATGKVMTGAATSVSAGYGSAPGAYGPVAPANALQPIAPGAPFSWPSCASVYGPSVPKTPSVRQLAAARPIGVPVSVS